MNIKREFQFLVILSIFILILPTMVFAVFSPPGIPLLVYGDVTIDNSRVPLGTEISAEIDGVKVAIVKTTNVGRYFIEIPDGKANENKMITFKVNGITHSSQLKCVNINTTPSINFNLSVVTPILAPAPTPTPAPAPTSGGGGGGGSYTYAPASTPSVSQLSEQAKKVDADKNNKIDVLDFNSLMVNWGKAETGNVADFDGSGKVDIFDFNLLMIHWTK